MWQCYKVKFEMSKDKLLSSKTKETYQNPGSRVVRDEAESTFIALLLHNTGIW